MPARTNRVDVAIAGALALGAWAAVMLVVGQLFPLAEFRDWNADGLGASVFSHDPLQAVWQGFTRQIAFARSLALVLAIAVVETCQPDITCLNAAVLVPVGLATGLLFLLARRLGIGIVLSAAAALTWLCSAPVIHALSWQATILDRLALLFLLLCILAYLAFTRTPLRNGGIVACNLVVLLATAAALMSKEAAFPLPAILLLLGAADIGHRAPRGRRLLGLVLPVGYGAFYELCYLRDYRSIAPGWAGHVTGGDVTANLAGYIDLLVPTAGWPGLAAGIVSAAGILLVLKSKRGPAGVVLMTALLLALPALPTRFAWPYYFYLPQAFFILAIAAVAQTLVAALPGAGRRSLATVVMVTLFLLIAVRATTTVSADLLRQQARASAQFRESLPRLRSLSPRGDATVAIVLTPALFSPHLFVDGTLRNLWRYVDPAVAVDIDPGNRVRMILGGTCPVQPEQLCLRYDALLTLVEIRM